MPISVTCSACGASLNAPDGAAGKTAKCPKCGSQIVVPTPVYDAEDTHRSPPPAPGRRAPPVTRPPNPLGTQQRQGAANEPTRRPCPACGELIVATAAKCRFCGEIFDPTLRQEESAKASKGDSDLAPADWVLAILCSGIGCIMGIVWLIQGKPKGAKMLGVSLLFVVIWNILSALIQIAGQG